MDRKAFSEAALSLGIALSDEQLDAFTAYEDALYKANEVMNLTRVQKEECWIRHFMDSLLLGSVVASINTRPRLLDIGTGPGIPSWCLACAFPAWLVTGLDSNGKMLGFLKNQKLPNLKTDSRRMEETAMTAMFEIVTGRAVAPLNIQLEISARACTIGGYVIPMRTPQDDPMKSVAGRLGLELVEVREIPLTQTDIVRAFPIYKKVRETSRDYPRKWADIKKRPL